MENAKLGALGVIFQKELFKSITIWKQSLYCIMQSYWWCNKVHLCCNHIVIKYVAIRYNMKMMGTVGALGVICNMYALGVIF